MGLFGSRKETYVDSVVYNMAGEYSERTKYLKYITLNGVLTNSGNTLTETITSGTLNGPRMNYRAFYRWAKENYPEGMPKAGNKKNKTITSTEVEEYIPTAAGNTAAVEEFFYGNPDYLLWAEKWLLENNPSALSENWDADIDDVTKIITIFYPNSSIATFVPVNFDPTRKYFYARYREVSPATGAVPVFVSGSNDFGPYNSESSLPDLTEYPLLNTQNTPINHSLYRITRITKSYSDGRPNNVTESKAVINTVNVNKTVKTYQKTADLYEDPLEPTRILRRLLRILIWQYPMTLETSVSSNSSTVEISPGVFETTVTDVLDESLGTNQWWYQEQEWKLNQGLSGNLKLLIYGIGTGNSGLDSLYPSDISQTGYFPTIPLRINNVMVDQAPYEETVYPKVTKAYKRASGGGKLSKLLDNLYDNEDLSDIDFAFIVWGVPLNTRSNEGKLYIYHYFKQLSSDNENIYASFIQYLDDMEKFDEFNRNTVEWYNTNGNIPPPRKPVIRQMPRVSVNTTGQNSISSHYNFTLGFNGAREQVFSGKWKPDAKNNEVKIIKGTPVSVIKSRRESRDIVTYTEKIPVMEIYWQEKSNQYRILTVIGGFHDNMVYNNKYVSNTTDSALNDSDDSGFIVPIHFELLKKMPIVKANQLCLESMLLVFNCYVVVKKKWYQTFLGSILIGLIFMGIGAVFSGVGSIMSGGGILGTNIAIGSMFGLSGLAGALAGAVLNTIAMTIVLNIVQTVAADMGALGSIFSMLISIGFAGMSGGILTGDFSLDFGMFLRTENLLKLTNSTISAYSVYINAKTQDIQNSMVELENAFEKEKNELLDKLYELTGISVNFDPIALTDALQSRESSKDFISRTMLTGSDIAEMSNELISNFTKITLSSELERG